MIIVNIDYSKIITDTVINNIFMCSNVEKAAPKFLTGVILKKLLIITNESLNLSIEKTRYLVVKSMNNVIKDIINTLFFIFFSPTKL